MKKTFPVFLILLFSIISSCSKDETTPTTPTTLTEEQILTSGIWKVDEIRFMTSNQFLYYKRGATSGNTANFDTESIKFNADHTGTYIAGGITYTLTWAFVDAAKTKLTFTISYATPLIVNWEHIIWKETSIQYSEYYNRTGTLSFGAGIRIH
jgi:hypothetical protein